jgi:hypothetical protein
VLPAGVLVLQSEADGDGLQDAAAAAGDASFAERRSVFLLVRDMKGAA